MHKKGSFVSISGRANQCVHSNNTKNKSACACSYGWQGAWLGATDDNLLNIVKNKHFASQATTTNRIPRDMLRPGCM